MDFADAVMETFQEMDENLQDSAGQLHQEARGESGLDNGSTAKDEEPGISQPVDCGFGEPESGREGGSRLEEGIPRARGLELSELIGGC